MRHLLRAVASILILGACLASPAQVPPGTPPPTEAPAETSPDTAPAPDTPQPIAAEDIPARAEARVATFQEIGANLELSPDVKSITDRVAEFSEEVTAYSAAGEQQLEVANLSIRDIEELHRQLGRYRGQIQDWQDTLARRSQELSGIKDTLSWSQQEWQLTLDRAESDETEVPEALVSRTHSVLATLDDLNAKCRTRLDEVLTLQNGLSEAVVSMNGFESRIDAAGAEVRQGMLVRDSPPMWAPESATWAGVTLGNQLRAAANEVRQVLGEVWQDYRSRVGYHLALLLVLIVVLFALGRRLRSWEPDDDSLAGARAVLAHPFAGATLLALVASFWFYPDVPRLADECFLLLMLVPVLRVVRDLIPAEMRRAVLVLVGLYLAHFLTLAAPDGSPLQRDAMLLVGLGGIAGITWLLRRSTRAIESRPTRRVMIVRALLRIAWVLLVVSVAANILGIVGLARVLSGGTVVSAWLAVILYASRIVLSSAVAIALRAEPAIRLAGVRRHRDLLQRRMNIILQVVTLFLWMRATLFVFGLKDWAEDFFRTILSDPIPFPGEIQFSVGGIVAFALTLWGASLLSRFIRFVLNEDVLPKIPLPRGVPGAISKGLNYLIMTIGFVLAVMATGIDINKFTLLAGAFGVGLGFGMQNIVNNFVSGLILLFERPVQVGDTIQIGTLIGTVREIGIRSSTVRTYEGAEVIVPNGVLIADQVVNWTLSDRQRRIEIPVGVAYGTDPHVVIEILLDSARKQPQAMTDPSPVALFQGFGESSLDFILRFWTTNFDDWISIRSQAILAIHDALKEADIEIPFPQRDVHIRGSESAGSPIDMD